MKLVLLESQTRTRNDCFSGILDLSANILEMPAENFQIF